MGNLVRFSISVEEELLAPFEDLCARKNSPTRSEAIRDLIRGALAADAWKNSRGSGSGTVTLVYDHHKNDLARRLMSIQHEYHDLIISSTHVHLDHDNCLEVLILKGEAEKVRTLAERLIACRGVKYGIFNPVPEARDLA